MKYLLLFEKYLESNYAPLYHYTKSHLDEIIQSNSLIKTRPYLGEDCICFTRNPIYSLDKNECPRLKLDQNKLRLDGYVPKSIDEFYKDTEYRYSIDRKHGNFYNNRTEWEYEERIFTDIKNLGKYIISIQFPKDTNFFTSHGKRTDTKNFIWFHMKDFLLKYPHIKIEEYDSNKRWLISTVDLEFS